jgi:uncharacterized protein YjbI with pentapeptide repeats
MSDKEIKPVIKADPLYQMLRQEDVDSFNASLRRMNARGLDFSNAYFRNCDLSGIDFRETNLEGASLMDAKVSGVYFPEALSANEIRLSLDHGTRLRYHRD